MRELLATVLFGLLIFAMLSPQAIGDWLKRVDEARYIDTMYE